MTATTSYMRKSLMGNEKKMSNLRQSRKYFRSVQSHVYHHLILNQIMAMFWGATDMPGIKRKHINLALTLAIYICRRNKAAPTK